MGVSDRVYSSCYGVVSVGITAFVRTESNTSVKLPTSERQPTAVIIRPYVIHSTLYIGDYRPTELAIIK
jgi:hypothetical protein